MDEINTLMSPTHAAKSRESHEICIDKRLITELWQPFTVPGRICQTDLEDAMGYGRNAFRHARDNGHVQMHFIKHLGGRRGRPVALVEGNQVFNPCEPHLFRKRLPVAGDTWNHLPWWVPDDFSQWVKRIPHQTLPRGYPHFRGWYWLCPGCNQRVSVLYFPVRLQTVLEYHSLDPAIGELDKMPSFPATFACARCHRVNFTSTVAKDWWNELISVYSGGLLYGKEVPRPAHFVEERARNYTPQLNRKSPMRDKIRRRLLNGWTYQQIAKDMDLSLERLMHFVWKICRQEHVKNRHELARKLGSSKAQPLNLRERARARHPQIESMLLKGASYQEIAAELKIKPALVEIATRTIYRKYGVESHVEFAKKLGIELNPDSAAEREQVRALRDQGLSRQATADKLGISVQKVDWHRKVLNGKNRAAKRARLREMKPAEQQHLPSPP